MQQHCTTAAGGVGSAGYALLVRGQSALGTGISTQLRTSWLDIWDFWFFNFFKVPTSSRLLLSGSDGIHPSGISRATQTLLYSSFECLTSLGGLLGTDNKSISDFSSNIRFPFYCCCIGFGTSKRDETPPLCHPPTTATLTPGADDDAAPVYPLSFRKTHLAGAKQSLLQHIPSVRNLCRIMRMIHFKAFTF